MTLRRTVGFGRRACVCGHSGVHQESRTHIACVVYPYDLRKYQCLRDKREHILKCNGTPCKISSVGAFHVLSLFSILAVRLRALYRISFFDRTNTRGARGCKSSYTTQALSE